MIRTRDFLLYVVVLMFLIIGVVYTGMFRAPAEVVTETGIQLTKPGLELSAVPSEELDTRAERLAALRAKIAAGEGDIVTAPPVFVSVDQVAAAQARENATSGPATENRSATYCGVPVAHVATLDWPTITEVRVVEGAYVFSTLVSETVLVGTSTETRETITPVLDVPIRTIRTNFDSCLPDTLVGVTSAGRPLVNTTASQFNSVPATSLVGYARDGFSIYGPLADSSVLDSCGGYYNAAGVYQYHIRANEPFILGCYAGIPIGIEI